MIVACDLAVVAVRTLGPEPTLRVRYRDAPGAPAGAPPGTVLPSGQAIVRGHATALAADAETVDAIRVPFTVEVPERGAGGATILGALVGGARDTVVWDGGRPLVVAPSGAAAGSLEPSPTHVELSEGGVRVGLDGANRSLAPGTYVLQTPVAVGAGGLATPRDRLTFTADTATSLATRGGAFVRLTARPVRLDGPGRVSADGTFTIRTRDGERRASRLVFGTGAFTLVARPAAAGGWDVEATFQGALEAT